jgi:hypothetical protein
MYPWRTATIGSLLIVGMMSPVNPTVDGKLAVKP